MILEGYEPPRDPRLAALQRHARPRRHRGQHPPVRAAGTSWSSARRICTSRRISARLSHREVHARRPAHRHRRRQSLRARRRHGRRTRRSCAARICCAACSPTGTTIRRCRTCSRACSSGRPPRRRASMRRATTRLYELEIAFQQLPRTGRRMPAVADGPLVPQSADRCHRQHAPRRVLHRQAVLARWARRAARPAGAARVRNAAARADEPDAAAAAALAGGALLAHARMRRRGWRAGVRELHDRFMLPYFVEQDFADVIAEQNAAGYALRRDWFAPHFEFRFPKYGDFAARGCRSGTAPGARAVARHGRGGRGRRHGALCRFIGGAAAGAR